MVELTAMAIAINDTFATLDHAVLALLHQWAENFGWFLTPFFKFISALSDGGVGLILLALGLMLFKKTRKAGVCVFGAVFLGAIITNIILKEWIARPRPFIDVTAEYYTWWQYVAGPKMSGYSFPSGHVTATMSAMTAIFLCFDRRYSWTAFIFVFLMGLSRNYLMVHYPSDVLVAVVVGLVAGGISFYITKKIFQWAETHKENKLCDFILNFSLRKPMKK